MNIADAIARHAAERPAHPAIEDGDRVVSYAELDALVDRAAARLAARGVATGDFVAMALWDNAAHVVVLLALARLGAISHAVDPGLPAPEQAKAVVGLAVKAALVENDPPWLLDLAAIPVGALVGDAAGGADAPAVAADPGFDADRPLMVIQSTGTTGEPKRLLLSHAQMLWRNRRLARLMGLTPEDRYLQVPALRFSAGRRRCIAILMVGGTVVLNHARNTGELLASFTAKNITYALITPSHLRSLLSGLDNDAPLCPRLKLGVTGSACPPELRLLAQRRLTPLMYDSYGMNEAAEVSLFKPGDENRYPDSLGHVVEGLEVEVVDENDVPLPFGETGSVRIRVHNFPGAYLNNPEATARHYRDGWFHPGDLVAMNADGYLFWRGRADEVINNEGAKYYPIEVEQVLRAHPEISDVTVIGGPHPQHGQATVAFIVQSGKLKPNDVYEFCKDRIALFKAPRWVFSLPEIPKTPFGKPDRKQLKEIFRRFQEKHPGA